MANEEYWTKVPFHIHYELCQRFREMQDVEDIEQDILLHVWKSRDKFEHKCDFDTWAWSIARRRIADFCRRAITRERKEMLFAMDERENRTFDMPRDMIAEIYAREILSKLSPMHRRIVLERLIGKKFEEIGSEFGLSYEATRSRYRRAIDKIRRSLASY